jgi:hypothetical protein
MREIDVLEFLPDIGSITPRSSAIVRRCGASRAKARGGNVAKKRLNRPGSSCRARGAVPYDMGLAPTSLRGAVSMQ